jgi:HK97 family phage major capsid protein
MSDDTKKVVDDLGKAWEDFKEANDQRLAEIEESGKATSETLEKFERVEKAFDEASKSVKENRERIEMLEAKASLPGNDDTACDDAQRKHLRAWGQWLFNRQDNETQMQLKEAERAAYDALPDDQKDVTLTTTGGGNAIPTLVAGPLIAKIKDMSPMRRLSRVVSSPNELTRFLVTDNNSTGGWVAAGSSRTQSTEPLIQAATPTYGTAYAYVWAYEEALNDLILNVPDWLSDDAASTLAAQEGTAFISGNGTARPTGITAGTPVSTGDEASPQRAFGVLQYTATGIAADFPGDRLSSPLGNPGDVFLDCLYSLKKEYRANAVWLMNKTVLASVRKFKDADGDYLYRPNFQGGMGDLFGYQVEEDENMADVGANAFPAAFGDFRSGYLISDIVPSLRVTVDDNVTAPGWVKFYIRRRLGGIVYNDDAIKLIKCATS